MADQLRWDATSYAGGAAAYATPGLDRIAKVTVTVTMTPPVTTIVAKEGLTMTYSYSSTPTCTPARAALLTGQSPWNHGMLGYGNVRLTLTLTLT